MNTSLNETPRKDFNPEKRWAAAAIAGAVLVACYAAFAALQIQVLNPLAAVPGSTLQEIHEAVESAGESMAIFPMTAVLAPGPLIAISFTICSMYGFASSKAAFRIQVALLTLGAPAYLLASFGAGMALADTFGINGSDYSAWATPLYVVSACSLFVLLFMAGSVTMRVLRGRWGVAKNG